MTGIKRQSEKHLILASGRAYPEYWKAWIDLNKDGDFLDAGEEVYSSGRALSTVASGNLSVPANAAGEVSFQWDGTDANGKRMPPGSYNILATHTDNAGAQSKLSTYVQAAVESVTVGTDGLYLNLKGLGAAPLDYVLRVS